MRAVDPLNEAGGGARPAPVDASEAVEMAIWNRPIDALICVLQCYFIFSCVCIERLYCESGLSADDKRFMMPETYQFAKDFNPYFLQGPPWLRLATCFSAYGFGFMYIVILVGFLFAINRVRALLLTLLGAKVYAIAFYHVMEYTSDTPPPDPLPYWATEGPFLLSIALLTYRAFSGPHLFAKPDQGKSGKRPKETSKTA